MIRKLLAASLFVLAFSGMIRASEKSTRVFSVGDVSCSSKTATSVMSNQPSRTGYSLVNLSSKAIRVSFLPTVVPGSTLLTSTNSIQIPANSALSDEIPSVTILPVTCQTTDTAGPSTLSILEFGQ